MFAFIFILIAFFGLFQQDELSTAQYRIKPFPKADRTDLEVSLDFKISGKEVNIKLPTDYFGTPNLHRFVTSFEGEAGTSVKAGENENERVVVPNSNGEIRLRYALSAFLQFLLSIYQQSFWRVDLRHAVLMVSLT